MLKHSLLIVLSVLCLFFFTSEIEAANLTFGEAVTIFQSDDYEVTLEDELVSENMNDETELSEEAAASVVAEINKTKQNFDIIETPASAAAASGIGGSNVSFSVSGQNIVVREIPPHVSLTEFAAVHPLEIPRNGILTTHALEQREELLGHSEAVSFLTSADTLNLTTSNAGAASSSPVLVSGSAVSFSTSAGGGSEIEPMMDDYQTLVLDGSKRLNIRQSFLNILYGNDTYEWDEAYTIPLVMFDVGTLIYNGIILDDTDALEHGYDFSDFINGVTFVGLREEYEYRLELNNGAVLLWAKLPTPYVPEPTTTALILLGCMTAATIRRRS